MPTIAQRCARRLPFGWTVEKTGVVASRTAMAPALAVDGDFVVQRAITLLIALRSVLADTLPARLAFGLVPTRAFDPSTGSIVSALSDGELSTSHAWLNNPTATGLAQSPRKWGVPPVMPTLRRRVTGAATVSWQRPSLVARPRAHQNVALSQRAPDTWALRLFTGFVLRPPAGTLFSMAILERDPDANQPDCVCSTGAADPFGRPAAKFSALNQVLEGTDEECGRQALSSRSSLFPKHIRGRSCHARPDAADAPPECRASASVDTA